MVDLQAVAGCIFVKDFFFKALSGLLVFLRNFYFLCVGETQLAFEKALLLKGRFLKHFLLYKSNNSKNYAGSNFSNVSFNEFWKLFSFIQVYVYWNLTRSSNIAGKKGKSKIVTPR